jgi:uroporphyrinogen III methyltransferase / synthase
MGTVYLVGAGPGDPGLLTVRAARLLRRAEIIVHDALISPEILAMIPLGAEAIDVGKRCGGRRTSQEEIHRILIESAGRARRVVRLKGGDPFVFGRGGEEALALREAGIRFRVVPGITAGVGAAAFAGIPVTHRHLSASVTFVTGHEDVGRDQSMVDWEALSRVKGTLVIYMGLSRLPALAARLVEAGRAADTPVAVVEWGTYRRQRTVRGSLATVAAVARDAGIEAPALVIVGEVAALHEELTWFEPQSLRGRRILVGRSRPEPSRLAKSLRGLGARVLEFPRLSAAPPAGAPALRNALDSLDGYDWILFTSVTAVDRFWSELRSSGRDARALAGTRFACLGRTTVAALARQGVRADAHAATFDPDRVADALLRGGLGSGSRVLFPREAGEQSPITGRLLEAGAEVTELAAFAIEADSEQVEGLRERISRGEVDVVVLPSSTAARQVAAAIGADLGAARVIAIGPGTAQTALACGLPVHAVPVEHTLPGLIRGIDELLTRPEVEADEEQAGADPRGTRIASQR